MKTEPTTRSQMYRPKPVPQLLTSDNRPRDRIYANERGIDIVDPESGRSVIHIPRGFDE